MSLLKPFSRRPALNTATILLVEREEDFQQRLAEVLVEETAVTLNVRLAKSLPLPFKNQHSRPRIDLVVFIINLTSELSLQSAQASLKYLDPGYFLGKVCFMATNARNAAVPPERLDTLRGLAASLRCTLLFAEDQVLRCGSGVNICPLQTADGASNASERLLTILKVAAGLVPMTTALYLSNLTMCTAPSNTNEADFD
ncbi:centromere protein M isoform X1 [Hippocampus zosterae]|uniref:centromere protein M isoform X1 n=1 Tax=Hippocampus zosterae TaxID=109293 RepID=UPI00223DFD11|nr:centromere protein M isoform X1 [Hippocampus zosterae]